MRNFVVFITFLLFFSWEAFGKSFDTKCSRSKEQRVQICSVRINDRYLRERVNQNDVRSESLYRKPLPSEYLIRASLEIDAPMLSRSKQMGHEFYFVVDRNFIVLTDGSLVDVEAEPDSTPEGIIEKFLMEPDLDIPEDILLAATWCELEDDVEKR